MFYSEDNTAPDIWSVLSENITFVSWCSYYCVKPSHYFTKSNNEIMDKKEEVKRVFTGSKEKVGRVPDRH